MVNKIARDLIELSNVQIVASSTNVFERPSGTNIQDIFYELNDWVDYVLDSGETKVWFESTVIRVIENKIHILRPGKITYKDLSKYAEVIIESHILESVKENENVLSPGMKYRHYALNNKCILVYSDDKNKMISEIQKLESDSTIVLTNYNNVRYFNNAIGYGETLEEISHNIFKLLRKVDKDDVKLIIIEGVKLEVLTIMNRLIRACLYNYKSVLY